MIRSRGRLYGDFSSRDKFFTIMWEVSSSDKNFKILIFMKIIFWINGIFCFNSRIKLKLRDYMEKNDVSSWDESLTRGQLAGMKFHPRMKYLFFACNHNLFFKLKTMARWDEILTRLPNYNFIPGWNLS